MACCEGQENVMKDVTPPEIQKLRKQQATIASNKLSSGATASPYGGPLSAQADPLTLMASNMMTGLAGYNPYQSPMQGGMAGGGGGGQGGPASWAGKYSSPLAQIQAAANQGGRGVLPNQPGGPTLPRAPYYPPYSGLTGRGVIAGLPGVAGSFPRASQGLK